MDIFPIIERWHRSMKNQVLLENYYLPGDLEARLGEFINYYNTQRYHESLNNLTPEDVYTGRGQTVLNRRMKIKRRRLYYKQKAA
jgi:putative transposase